MQRGSLLSPRSERAIPRESRAGAKGSEPWQLRSVAAWSLYFRPQHIVSRWLLMAPPGSESVVESRRPSVAHRKLLDIAPTCLACADGRVMTPRQTSGVAHQCPAAASNKGLAASTRRQEIRVSSSVVVCEGLPPIFSALICGKIHDLVPRVAGRADVACP